MRETTISRTYAEALLEIAHRQEAIEPFGEYLHLVADLIESDRRFRLFLETPRIDPPAKKQVIREVFGPAVPELLLNFLMVVIDKRRQRLIPSMADRYAELLDEHFGRIQVRVSMAAEPDRKLQDELKRRLEALLDKEVLPIYRTDERIIGGVIVRVGDRLMDGSIRRRLQLLRRQLLKAEIA